MAEKLPGAHDAALNLGVLNEIFSHHENKGYKKRGYGIITLDFCDLIARSCAKLVLNSKERTLRHTSEQGSRHG